MKISTVYWSGVYSVYSVNAVTVFVKGGENHLTNTGLSLLDLSVTTHTQISINLSVKFNIPNAPPDSKC